MSTLIGAIALIVIARWFFRSTLADAVAETLRTNARGTTRTAGQPLERTVKQLTEELAQLRQEQSELAERLDFTERVLMRARQQGALHA